MAEPVQNPPAHKQSLVTGHVTQYSRLTTERLNAGTQSIRPAAEDLQSSERAAGQAVTLSTAHNHHPFTGQ